MKTKNETHHKLQQFVIMRALGVSRIWARLEQATAAAARAADQAAATPAAREAAAAAKAVQRLEKSLRLALARDQRARQDLRNNQAATLK